MICKYGRKFTLSVMVLSIGCIIQILSIFLKFTVDNGFYGLLIVVVTSYSGANALCRAKENKGENE